LVAAPANGRIERGTEVGAGPVASGCATRRAFTAYIAANVLFVMRTPSTPLLRRERSLSIPSVQLSASA
jgi:hypothetical protein